MLSEQVLAIYGYAFGSAGCAAVAAYPAVSRFWMKLANRVEGYEHEKMSQTTRALEDIFIEVKPMWLQAIYGLGPLAVGIGIFLVFNNFWLGLAGAVLGRIVPSLGFRFVKMIRKQRFEAQLVDALFILSSSLKAGLSLTQAFEVVESEMPAPASQEFGLVTKANRLGRTFEDSLQGLNQRMGSEELNLLTTALLVARETGGNVTTIIDRLIIAIRERKKLQEKVKTLTLQGRVQAYIMSVLPVAFVIFTRTVSTGYFETLLQDSVGSMLLTVAGVLWVVGMVLLIRMSRVEV